MTGHITGDARKRQAELAGERQDTNQANDLDLSVAVRHELIEHVLGLDAESVVDRVILPLRDALTAGRESVHPSPEIEPVGDSGPLRHESGDGVDRLRELLAAGTPLPWHWEEPSTDDWPSADESLVAEDGAGVLIGWGYDASGIAASDEDRALIAEAMNALPALLDELASLRAPDIGVETTAEYIRRLATERKEAVDRLAAVRTVIVRWEESCIPEAAGGQFVLDQCVEALRGAIDGDGA